jgi:hypothetical protein
MPAMLIYRFLLAGSAYLGRPGLRAEFAAHIVGEQNGIGDFAHGFATVAALALQRVVGALLVQPQVALENRFRFVDDAPSFQPLGELKDFHVQAARSILALRY